jgi:hypothetical protein
MWHVHLQLFFRRIHCAAVDDVRTYLRLLLPEFAGERWVTVETRLEAIVALFKREISSRYLSDLITSLHEELDVADQTGDDHPTQTDACLELTAKCLTTFLNDLRREITSCPELQRKWICLLGECVDQGIRRRDVVEFLNRDDQDANGDYYHDPAAYGFIDTVFANYHPVPGSILPKRQWEEEVRTRIRQARIEEAVGTIANRDWRNATCEDVIRTVDLIDEQIYAALSTLDAVPQHSSPATARCVDRRDEVSDLTAFRPMSEFLDSQHGVGTCSKLHRFLEHHPEIRQIKKPRRRDVHAGDWLKYWSKEDKRNFEARDVECYEQGMRERQAEIREKKQRYGRTRPK